MINLKYFSLIALLLVMSCDSTLPPEPLGPLPSARQLAWHDLEFYAFVHFNMNTFTDMEWGFGGESTQLFNPTQLDCRQWARVCKDAGMKGIILTAKHHDGFCLWPSAYSEHSVKNSPWKNGKGDVVRELAEACKEYGLKMGIYLSPWDRNHADYGRPGYLTYFRNQLRELMTNYGELFEVWFDGANGGTGYYGGANEERKIDNKTYYDWTNTRKIVRELQPNAMMFSDAGPDVRWVGNESGWAGETNWCMQRRDEFHPGYAPNRDALTYGQIDGTHWVPAEVDVSIRPGWYYHKSEDHKVKSVKQLVDIYYHSVGRNASLLLNFPVDDRGLIHERDVEQLSKMVDVIRNDLKTNLVNGVKIEATNTRGNSSKFAPNRVVDGKKESYWATDGGVTEASLILDFREHKTFNRFLVQEHIQLGQRVKSFSIEALVNGDWKLIDTQTTIGYKRILRFDNVTSSKLRFNILDAKACPTISNLEVFHAPKLLEAPSIARDKAGEVTILAFDSGLDVFYTIDGSEPNSNSTKYQEPFDLPAKGQVQAIAFDPASGGSSNISTQAFDICKDKWVVISPDIDPKGKFAVDANPESIWKSDPKKGLPQSVVVDLGEILELTGFTYLPTQQRYIDGTISEYQLFVSKDGNNWRSPVSSGEFSNIRNNPVMQTKTFGPESARFVKFVGNKEINGKNFISIAELGILTE